MSFGGKHGTRSAAASRAKTITCRKRARVIEHLARTTFKASLLHDRKTGREKNDRYAQGKHEIFPNNHPFRCWYHLGKSPSSVCAMACILRVVEFIVLREVLFPPVKHCCRTIAATGRTGGSQNRSNTGTGTATTTTTKATPATTSLWLCNGQQTPYPLYRKLQQPSLKRVQPQVYHR